MTSKDSAPGEIDTPTDLTREDYVAALRRTLKEVKDDDVPGLAGGVAFKIFLAMFPAMFAAVAIFSIVTTVSELQQWLDSQAFLPDNVRDIIGGPLKELAQSDNGLASFAAVIGVATGLWAASGAAMSLMKALSRAYDVPETRKFVKGRLVALALTAALLASLVGIIVLMVAGPQIQSAVLGEVAAPFSWLLATVRVVLAIIVLVLLFAFVYWIGPNRDHPSWVWITPGAVVGVIGWLLASGAFGIYAQRAGSYAAYGAIAGVAVILVWLQLSMLVILVGAEFNAEIERTKALYLRVGEGAGFATPAATAGLVPPDRDAAWATLAESEMAAHAVHGAEPDDQAPTLPALPPLSTPTPATDGATQVRRAGAVAAGLTAAAVFLGFARRRARR
jgi:membrane protein